MGIKDLWSILTPFCERKPLFDLQGKVVAVDLSGWVCQAQCITEHHIQPRMYLRNLYFRTCFLLLQEVSPVFVLEGDAPTLKYKTIASRNQIQFKGAKPRAEGAVVAPKKGRSRFHHVLKQCEEMIKHMGLACVTGKGEAEAMCAYLNEEGMVDGCISQDSDCFAYGAYVVYRNFSISQQGAHAASGGSVDVYDIRKATQATDFGRNKVIALALLCGSDYNEGVFGIGKDSALKFFDSIADVHILDRIKSWRSSNNLYDDLEKKNSDKNICTQCGHSGKKVAHTRSGCCDCGTRTGCQFNGFSEKRLEIKNEINIRNKALEDPEFPCEELMGEFLVRKDSVAGLNLRWKRPDMRKFVKFTAKQLQWDEVYCFEKFLPILTRWTVIHYKAHKEGVDIKPDYIKKCRNPKGVKSYEIIWHCDIFKDLLPDSQLADVDLTKLFSTIEPQDLVLKAYPNLVETYQLSKVKPKKAKRVKKAKVASIENFLIRKDVVDERVDSDMSCFGDEDNEVDLSLVVEDIINRGLPKVVREKLSKLVRALEENGTTKVQRDDLNSSSFFMGTGQREYDLFEATFNRPDDSSSSDEETGTTNTRFNGNKENIGGHVDIHDESRGTSKRSFGGSKVMNNHQSHSSSDDGTAKSRYGGSKPTENNQNDAKKMVSTSFNIETSCDEVIGGKTTKTSLEASKTTKNNHIGVKKVVSSNFNDYSFSSDEEIGGKSSLSGNNFAGSNIRSKLYESRGICDDFEMVSEDPAGTEDICNLDDTFDEVYVPLYERLRNKK